MSGGALDRLGVFLFPWGAEPPTAESIVELARRAEALGFESVHIPWHHTMPPGPNGNRFILDPLVVLPMMVAATSRIRIGLSSAVLPSHHPYVWAQYLSSLDVASGGRVIAGAAIGWWDEDLKIGGARKSERGARTDDALEIITSLWEGRPIAAPGRFWDAAELALDPTPAQRPMPLWVGGGPVAIERAARWGSALMPLDMRPGYARDELRPSLDAAAARHGRSVGLTMMNYSIVSDDDAWIAREIVPRLEKAMSHMSGEADRGPRDTMILGTPEDCAAQIQAFFDAGVDYIVLNAQFHGAETEAFGVAQWERFAAEVAPLVSCD